MELGGGWRERYARRMKSITELLRVKSPVPKPQALYVDGRTVWLSSRQTGRLYAVDRATWQITWETAAPGTAWGVTKVGDSLRVVCGTDASDVDDRTIRRCVPGQGFDAAPVWACPDGMGSHVSFDGHAVILSQWYPKKLIAFDGHGIPTRVWPAPHGICGHCFALGAFWLVSTDAEDTTDYWLTRLDPATGAAENVARIGFAARALAFDGENFWTNHREENEIVSFARPVSG